MSLNCQNCDILYYVVNRSRRRRIIYSKHDRHLYIFECMTPVTMWTFNTLVPDCASPPQLFLGKLWLNRGRKKHAPFRSEVWRKGARWCQKIGGNWPPNPLPQLNYSTFTLFITSLQPGFAPVLVCSPSIYLSWPNQLTIHRCSLKSASLSRSCRYSKHYGQLFSRRRAASRR